jgi:hypothetical protein
MYPILEEAGKGDLKKKGGVEESGEGRMGFRWPVSPC